MSNKDKNNYHLCTSAQGASLRDISSFRQLKVIHAATAIVMFLYMGEPCIAVWPVASNTTFFAFKTVVASQYFAASITVLVPFFLKFCFINWFIFRSFVVSNWIILYFIIFIFALLIVYFYVQFLNTFQFLIILRCININFTNLFTTCIVFELT